MTSWRLCAGAGIIGWATSCECLLTAWCAARCWQWADEGAALPTGQPVHGRNTAAGPACPTNRAACSWTQHRRWSNLPYQPGSLLMDATLPLDQLALPTGQPAHGRNTAAGPTCPTNRAACPWTQHCRWSNFPYQPGSLLMDAIAGQTCSTNRAACSWTQQLDQLALPTGQPAHEHNSWTNWPYQTGSLLMDTTAGPTCPACRGPSQMGTRWSFHPLQESP